jgi:hypothetical protein
MADHYAILVKLSLSPTTQDITNTNKHLKIKIKRLKYKNKRSKALKRIRKRIFVCPTAPDKNAFIFMLLNACLNA